MANTKKGKPSKNPRAGKSTQQGRMRHAQVLPFLAAGMPREQIATITGFSVRQIERWSQDPEVKTLLAELEQKALMAAEKALTSIQGVAIGALADVMLDPKAKPDARVKASLGVLDRTKLGPTKRLEHTGANGAAIRTETAILEGQPVTKRDVAAQARALAEQLESELAAEAQTGEEAGAAVVDGEVLPAPLLEVGEDDAAGDDEDEDGETDGE
jgi:hypothetical protein